MGVEAFWFDFGLDCCCCCLGEDTTLVMLLITGDELLLLGCGLGIEFLLLSFLLTLLFCSDGSGGFDCCCFVGDGLGGWVAIEEEEEKEGFGDCFCCGCFRKSRRLLWWRRWNRRLLLRSLLLLQLRLLLLLLSLLLLFRLLRGRSLRSVVDLERHVSAYSSIWSDPLVFFSVWYLNRLWR